jgi:hypothetical protein
MTVSQRAHVLFAILLAFPFCLYCLGSDLYRATLGIGLIQFEARANANARHPLEDSRLDVMDNPVTNQEKMIASWQKAVRDPVFLAYVQEKTRFMEPMVGSGYVPVFAPEPFMDSSFLYDAVTAMGIAMCQAQAEFFTAKDVAPLLQNLSFRGATGNVVFSETGTRDYRTVTFTVWNAVPRDPQVDDSQGLRSFTLIPIHSYSEGAWKHISETNKFIYADGTTFPPDHLAPVEATDNYVNSASLAIGLSMLGLAMLSSLYCLGWTIVNRREPVVCAAQMTFLVMIASGSLVMSASGIPLALLEVDFDRQLNSACMVVPWMFNIGLSAATSAISVKLWRIREVRSIV